MNKINIAGLNINPVSKHQLLNWLLTKIQHNQPIWLTTVYSEFLFAGLRNPKIISLLNQADIAVPDGISLFWAQRFLNLPLTAKTYSGKILQTLWQAGYSLLAILFKRQWIISALPEKIVGADLIWDLAKMAEDHQLSLYLLGGFGNTPKLVSEKIKIKNLKLNIKGYSNKNPNDLSIIDDINKSNPDILLVAYGPIKQEQWILEHKHHLPGVKLFIGVGGSFDYIAHIRPSPPKHIRQLGLEWLWRLITQPHRIKRIWQATYGLINLLIHYKVFATLPLRPNVVIVILNNQNQVLIGQRNPQDFHTDIITTKAELQKNYWQLPQGGIDKKEDLVISAKREAWEETGLTDLTLIHISPHTHIYFWNNAIKSFLTRKQFRGQEQRIVYLRHANNNPNVNVDNHEFINYKWIGINELNNYIHPEREGLTNIVLSDLNELLKQRII